MFCFLKPMLLYQHNVNYFGQLKTIGGKSIHLTQKWWSLLSLEALQYLLKAFFNLIFHCLGVEYIRFYKLLLLQIFVFSKLLSISSNKSDKTFLSFSLSYNLPKATNNNQNTQTLWFFLWRYKISKACGLPSKLSEARILPDIPSQYNLGFHFLSLWYQFSCCQPLDQLTQCLIRFLLWQHHTLR